MIIAASVLYFDEKKYDEVYVVNTIDAKIFGSKNMWHWEVGAN